MKHFNFLSNLLSLLRAHRVHTLALTVGSPSAHRRGTMLRLCSVVAILLTIGVGNVWGTETTVYTFATAKSTSNTAYASNYNVTISSKSWSVPGNQNFSGYVRIGGKNLSKVDRIIKSNDAISGPITKVTLNHGGKSNNSLTVHSITLTVASNSTFSSIISTETKTPEISLSTAGTVTFTPPSPLTSWPNNSYYKITINVSNSSSSNNYGLDVKSIAFIKETFTVSYNNNGGSGTMTDSNSPYLKGSTVTVKSNSFTAPDGKTFNNWNTASGGSGTSYAAGNTFNIVGNTTLYAQWETVASCSVNPTAGAASLNGSISLSSLPVQTTGWTVGTNCSWSDFGFVWSTSVSSPTLESNGTASTNCTKIQKATSGTATSTAQSITGSFSVGASYYVRGYGKNGYASGTYQYTDVLTITPRSITFNSNGGSSVSTIYVNSGTAASAPTAPTKTGYTFGGWYTDNGTFESAVNWSSTISENKTYYAKWTAKGYTINLDNQTPTTASTPTSIKVTYNASTNLTGTVITTLPTKTGYDFGGYYTSTGGGGSQVIDADGVVVASVASYTGASKEWIYAGDKTLYAKWTIKNYTVTWKVNDVAYTPKTTTGSGTDGSANANHGTAWSSLTLPTDPDPEDYCEQVFVGWTTDNIGTTGLDKDDDDDATRIAALNLMTSANKSGKSTTITDNIIFYAVFADYTTD